MPTPNLLFRIDPAAFLAYNMLHPNPGWGAEAGTPDARDLVAGIHHFDILAPIAGDRGSRGLHLLRFHDRGAQYLHRRRVEGGPVSHAPAPRPDSWRAWFFGSGEEPRRGDPNPLRAYWLPFMMNRTFEMRLGAEADFFFTAGLSGCTVVISGDPQAPTVAHVNRMDGPELERLREKVAPRRESWDPLGVRNLDGGYEDLRPAPTKAETTTRQILMQELKATVAARAAGTRLRGDNAPERALSTPDGGIRLGGPRGEGGHLFGVVDYTLHYEGPSPLDRTANVVGYRRPSGNWRFVYQVFGSTGHAFFQREPLRCAVCKARVAACGCPG